MFWMQANIKYDVFSSTKPSFVFKYIAVSLTEILFLFFIYNIIIF